jgi:hypothetical protein
LGVDDFPHVLALLCHFVGFRAENRLLCEPLDGAGKRLFGQRCSDPARSVTWPAITPARRFPVYRARRAARKVRCRSLFSAGMGAAN